MKSNTTRLKRGVYMKRLGAKIEHGLGCSVLGTVG